MPFEFLFYNTIITRKYEHEFAMTALKNSLDSIKSRDLINATSFVFQHLNTILIDQDETVKDAVLKFCFTLLRHIIALMNQIQDVKIRTELKEYIFAHPSLKYLENQLSSDILHFENLNTFPSEIDVSVSFFFTQVVILFLLTRLLLVTSIGRLIY